MNVFSNAFIFIHCALDECRILLHSYFKRLFLDIFSVLTSSSYSEVATFLFLLLSITLDRQSVDRQTENYISFFLNCSIMCITGFFLWHWIYEIYGSEWHHRRKNWMNSISLFSGIQSISISKDENLPREVKLNVNLLMFAWVMKVIYQHHSTSRRVLFHSARQHIKKRVYWKQSW